MTTTDQASLLDGNVLVALVIDSHEHHDVALAWFGLGFGYATSPITQGTLLRMLLRQGHSSGQAAAVLERILRSDRHHFWADERSYDAPMLEGVQGHRQVTDAYLAQMTRDRRGRLVTFDRGLAALHHDVASLVADDLIV